MEVLHNVNMSYGNAIRLSIYRNVQSEIFIVHINLNRGIAEAWAADHGFNEIDFTMWLGHALTTETARLQKGFTEHCYDIYRFGKRWMEYICQKYRRYHYAYAFSPTMTTITISANATGHFLDYLNEACKGNGYMVHHIPEINTAAVLDFLEEVEQC